MAKLYNFPLTTVVVQADTEYLQDLSEEDIPEVDYEELYNTNSNCFKCGKSLDYTQNIWNISQSGTYDEGAEMCDECMMKFFNM